MPKKKMKSRPVSFRLPVEAYSQVAAAARRSGLSIGAFAAQLALEGSERLEADSVEEEQAFTDWRDAQLPPGDRADTPDEDGDTGALNPEFRQTLNPEFRQDPEFRQTLNDGNVRHYEQTPESARGGTNEAVDGQSDGSVQGADQGAGDRQEHDGRGVPGLDVTAVSDQERPGGSDDDPECPLRGPFSSDPATNGDPLISDAASGDGFDFTPAANADGSPLTGQGDLSDLGDGGTQPRSSEGAGEAVPGVREDERQREMDGQLQHERARAARVAALDADRRRERFNALRER